MAQDCARVPYLNFRLYDLKEIRSQTGKIVIIDTDGNFMSSGKL